MDAHVRKMAEKMEKLGNKLQDKARVFQRTSPQAPEQVHKDKDLSESANVWASRVDSVS